MSGGEHASEPRPSLQPVATGANPAGCICCMGDAGDEDARQGLRPATRTSGGDGDRR